MLLVLMYHHVNNRFEEHLKYIADNHQIVVPGDQLKLTELQVCLTFDDAYFDFYSLAYPCLKKLGLKAVLGVPVKYILPDTNLSAQTRLHALSDFSIKNDDYEKYAPFCTWQELREMQTSGHVLIASHSYSHADLSQQHCNLHQEIIKSKSILEQQLAVSVDTFIYPFGNFNHDAHRMVKKNYTYNMRIGSALNFSWHNSDDFIYRVDAEHYWPQQTFLTKSDYIKYLLKYISNIIRRK